ncbi:MAG: hypothetical protein COU40_01790 [Candidatus Moranbacteria bacterium CG10_big_fil_rev_8_21_14_0_10_35_21]|nr:MAG: hypothetical protein COU40_01790 [Candidatus Moranbacteria bacterium CG10_big_fil_rev_8_21_14_0_10_35_21]PJA88966.1 MAG: hypothetical protein CO139_00280 [Candidatus Moranbacteria bacterium CG_4_9_14_3_um_filter_36_9]
MKTYKVKAKIEKFTLPLKPSGNHSVVVPTVKGSWISKYSKHAYYFYNFKNYEGFCVEISHKDIIKLGLNNLKKVLNKKYPNQSVIKLLLGKYHYGFNSLEQMAIMTVPHAVTALEDGCFIINLWSYFGYLIVDCKKMTVEYKIADDDYIFGSQQWLDPEKRELYQMSYSLADSLKKTENPFYEVSSRITRRRINDENIEEMWKGNFSDYMHDIIVNNNKQYCVACELGMFVDDKNNIIPSKVLILDLKNKKQWIISRFIVAAHAQFDPNDQNIVYFSSHNFQFKHSNIFKALWNASYDIDFRGPASVYKYKLTENGPEEMAVFTEPDLFRLTNVHIFSHRGQKILAAIGSPNFIFIADAENMKLIRKFEIQNNAGFFGKRQCRVGTISPSPDGEKLYVQTNHSFQIIDIASEKAEFIKDLFFTHMCANHMLTSNDTNW